MRIALSAVVIVLFGTTILRADDVNWRTDYAAARREAKATGKPLLLDFGTDDCVWCKKQDATTFRDPAVVKLLAERVIPVKIDAMKNRALAEGLAVESFPTIVLASADGTVLDRKEGYIAAKDLLLRLERHTSRPALAAAPSAERAVKAAALLALAELDAAIECPAAAADKCRQILADYADCPAVAGAKSLLVKVDAKPVR